MADTKRQEQTRKDRERARERRLEHTARRRRIRLEKEETAGTVGSQQLPETHRR